MPKQLKDIIAEHIEMGQYAKGGGVGSYKILNELYELKSDGVKKVQLNGFFESIGYVIDLKLDDSQIKKIDLGEYQTTYAKGGGVRRVGNREYSTGRNWTNDHKHVNKSEEHEVKYTRKKSFAGGGGVGDEIQYGSWYVNIK
jgi:hypothetical protein